MLDSLDWLFNAMALTFLVLIFMTVVVVFVWLGSLPGTIATQRGHRYATAVTACGWLGLLTGILWPIAFVWAFMTPSVSDERRTA